MRWKFSGISCKPTKVRAGQIRVKRRCLQPLIDDSVGCDRAGGQWFQDVDAEGCRIGGRAEGIWRFAERTETGERFVKVVSQLHKGESHGFHKEYYPSGRIRMSGQMRGGKETGTWKGYYEGGQLGFEVTWVEGKREGAIQEWYQNCQISMEGQFKGGQRTALGKSGTECNQNGMANIKMTRRPGMD